jgi:membrane fusion protein, heavy metal efflux system
MAARISGRKRWRLDEVAVGGRFTTEGSSGWRQRALVAVVAIVALALMTATYFSARAETGEKPAPPASSPGIDSVELSQKQLGMIDLGTVAERTFPVRRDAVGSIDFNEDVATPVYTPYQGRIEKLFARIGDTVAKDQVLFTIQSPDLIQADSTLIAAAAVEDLTERALARAKRLYEVQGIAEKDLQQAISDQQTAEGALEAARNAVEVFGKTKAEIDHMVKTRSIDPNLVVRSPISGQITARNAAPGLFVQPGNPPAPYSVADISRVWMVANVSESDMPLVHTGQRLEVAVMAFPDDSFKGQISTVGATVDPQLHRGMVRAEVEDPKHELLPGMLASFVIVTGEPVTAGAVPLDGVVREGDGTMTVWVTTDRHRFTKRTVRIGLSQDGYDQILEGVRPGDLVVTKGAVFLDNLLSGGLS